MHQNRHVHITSLQRHVHIAAPTDAGPHRCMCRHFCTDASAEAWPDMPLHKHIHISVPAEVWQHRCT